jgi:hypothetical protein
MIIWHFHLKTLAKLVTLARFIMDSINKEMLVAMTTKLMVR